VKRAHTPGAGTSLGSDCAAPAAMVWDMAAKSFAWNASRPGLPHNALLGARASRPP